MTIYSVKNHKQYQDSGIVRRRVSKLKHVPATKSFPHSQSGSSMGFFLAGIGILFLIVAAGFLYISQVTTSAVNGYDTSSLEKQVEQLKEQKRQLELAAADLQSLKNISHEAVKLNLEPVEKTAFTSPMISGTVALSGFGGGS